jgi:hypothetical protein
MINKNRKAPLFHPTILVMIGLLLILASQFLFTSGYNRTYTLDPESKSFWIYVKVSKNATQNWT